MSEKWKYSMVSIGFLAMCAMGFIFPVNITADNAVDPPQPVPSGESETITITGKVGNGNEETPGEWFAGDAPSQPISNDPVLLFVPGVHTVDKVIWSDNGIYASAITE